MKEKLFILVSFAFVVGTIVYSQKKIPVNFKNKQIFINEDDVITTSRILKKMKLDYQEPNGFKEDSTYSLEKYPALSYKLHSDTKAICSEDNQFVSFLTVYSVLTKKDEKYYKELFPRKSCDFVDKQHLYQMKGILRNFYGEEMEQKWREKVITYPKYEAQKKFNADKCLSVFNSTCP